MTDDFARRVTGVAALAEPVRRDLYLYVVAEPEPVSRDQAAAGVGVPRHTAKFHLDRLVEEGLLETEFRRLSGRQRPGRRSAGQALPAQPGRGDGLAAGAPLRPRRPAAGAARSRTPRGTGRRLPRRCRAARSRSAPAWAPRPATRAGDPVTAAAAQSAACDVLAEHGYEPRVDDGSITLQNCPFHGWPRSTPTWCAA